MPRTHAQAVECIRSRLLDAAHAARDAADGFTSAPEDSEDERAALRSLLAANARIAELAALLDEVERQEEEEEPPAE